MSERIDNLSSADLAVVNYFDRISRKLDVTLEVDGSSVVIDGEDGLKRLRAREEGRHRCEICRLCYLSGFHGKTRRIHQCW